MTDLYDEKLIIYTNALLPADDLCPANNLYPIWEGEEMGIASGSITLERMVAESELRFGKACATKFECDVYNGFEGMIGRSIELYVTMPNESTVYLFKGKVESAEKDSRYIDCYHLIAYDELAFAWNEDCTEWLSAIFHQYKTDGRHWNNVKAEDLFEALLTATNTRLDKSISEYKGDSLIASVMNFNATAPFIWSDEWEEDEEGVETVKTTISEAVVKSITYRSVLSMICEIMAVFPLINGSGQLTLLRLGTTADEIEVEETIDSNSKFENYTTTEIDGVEIQGIGGTYVYDYEQNADNRYIMQDNLIIGSLDTRELSVEKANALVGIVEGLRPFLTSATFVPVSVELKISDFERFALCDKILYDGNESFVLKSTLSGDLMLSQSVGSASSQRQTSEQTYDYERD